MTELTPAPHLQTFAGQFELRAPFTSHVIAPLGQSIVNFHGDKSADISVDNQPN